MRRSANAQPAPAEAADEDAEGSAEADEPGEGGGSPRSGAGTVATRGRYARPPGGYRQH